MVVACSYWCELTDGFWGQFVLTQVPHVSAADLLPAVGDRFLHCMSNLFGMLRYIRPWVWAADSYIQAVGPMYLPYAGPAFGRRR